MEMEGKENEVENEGIAKRSCSSVFTGFFAEVTLFTQFTGRFFKELFIPPFRFNELVKQCYLVGCKSFPLVAVTGFIMGLVLTIQSRPTLAQFGAESWLPAMVAVSIS